MGCVSRRAGPKLESKKRASAKSTADIFINSIILKIMAGINQRSERCKNGGSSVWQNFLVSNKFKKIIIDFGAAFLRSYRHHLPFSHLGFSDRTGAQFGSFMVINVH